MRLDGDALQQLLPAIYRLRDAGQGHALGALIDVLAEQVQVLQEDLAQLYDDQFIETCTDWVVPYIGDLIGYRPLNGVTAAVSSPRAEVANTIHLRRGKGTVAVLEQLARDVTGWDAKVVEYFQLLAVTQCLKHVRPGRGGTVDLRDEPRLERIGSAFDSVARSADLRAIGHGGGRANLPHIGIHLWRLGGSGLRGATAFGLDGQRFLFNPLGIDTALCLDPQPLPGDSPLAGEANLPLPISRRRLAADLATGTPGLVGPGRAITVDGLLEGTVVLAADLSDLDAGGTRWAHVPAAGTLLLDPVRGRLAYAEPQAAPPRVSFRYGSAAEIGGGEYERLATLNLALAPVVDVAAGPNGLQAALDAVASGGAVELPDSSTRSETPAIALAAGAVVELRAADQCRPVLRLGGELTIRGAAGAELTLNGLVIAGGPLRVVAGAGGASLRSLRLVHCTLVPGLSLAPDGRAAQPGAPSLVVETEGTEVVLDHCITGALRIAPESTLTLSTSVVDAGDAAAVALAGVDGAAAGAPLTASESTLIGRVHSAALGAASNCIFLARAAIGEALPWPAPVWSERRQDGCLRFSYLPLDSLVPRRYRCQPAFDADRQRVLPMFDALRYGDPAYARLSRRAALEIRNGADDGGEMGVHHEQLARQRESNLHLRLAEYLRVGLAGGLLFED